MADNTQSSAYDLSTTITPKTIAAVLVAVVGLLAAGAGSLGYFAISYIFDNNGAGFTGDHTHFESRLSEHKQSVDERLERHRQRVFETCATNRKAVEYQLEAQQIQIRDLSEWINKI